MSKKLCIVLLTATITGCGTQNPQTNLQNIEPGRQVSLFNGKDLSGWRILNEIYFDRPGEVKVNDGKLTLGRGDDLTGVCWKGKVLKDNYEISFQARRVEGSDFFCGLTFPVRDGDATLILGGWGGRVVGLTAVDNYSAAENNTTHAFDFEMGRWYEIRLRVADGYVRVFRDGKMIINQEIDGHTFEVWPQMEEARPLSFSTYDTVGQYRNIRYTRLRSKSSAPPSTNGAGA